MYKERAIVDLSYHHFTIDNKEYTQVEVIDKILDVCRDYLLSNEPDYKKISEAIKWFSEIFTCMWW